MFYLLGVSSVGAKNGDEDLDKRKSRFTTTTTPMEREQDDRTGRCDTRLIKMERGHDLQTVRK